MDKNLKEEIKKYVTNWHWNEDSKKYAFEMGKFLFSFKDYLNDQEISERTKRTHISNLYLIGTFESNYGFNDHFHPKNLANGPHFLYEFERKVSSTKYAIQSYMSTWKKLDHYIKSGDYVKYFKSITL